MSAPIPDSTDKFPRLGGFFSSEHYPQYAPVDVKTQTTQILKFGGYTTALAYGWLYLFKRTTFKLGLPLTAIAFGATATATKGMVTNLREKNDAWNTFWGVLVGNTVVLTAGFKLMPLRNKVLTGLAGAGITAVLDNFFHAELVSLAGQDAKFVAANGDEKLAKQQFWDVWQRRPLLQTVEELGVGRGIGKSL